MKLLKSAVVILTMASLFACTEDKPAEPLTDPLNRIRNKPDSADQPKNAPHQTVDTTRH
jgi:hypothetical protein